MDKSFFINSILEYVEVNILAVDSNFKITQIKGPTIDLTGIVNAEEVIGKNLFDVFPKLKKEESTIYHVLTTGKIVNSCFQTFINAKGKKTVALISATLPYYENGELKGALELFGKTHDFINFIERLAEFNPNNKEKNNDTMHYDNGTIYCLDDVISKSFEMETLKNTVIKIADSISPVLIYGETGTGKEVLAQGIHNASIMRSIKPFIAQNCAAIPTGLLESLLFGTTSGSFTGAKDNPGLFELADGGTLYLDELNSMDIVLQAKILRVLQDGVIRRVGSKKTKKVDVRIIASTNVDPLKAVENNQLRKDLFYRLNVFYLKIPPLKERKVDIPLLILEFMNLYNKILDKKVNDISEESLNILMNYDWPGNIRELKNVIEQIMNYIEGDKIGINDLPKYIIETKRNKNKINVLKNTVVEENNDNDIIDLKKTIGEFEKLIIIDTLNKTNSNYAEAARKLNLPRHTLYSKLKKYNLT